MTAIYYLTAFDGLGADWRSKPLKINQLCLHRLDLHMCEANMRKIYVFIAFIVYIEGIHSHYYDGLKFACIDFSSQQQKRRRFAYRQTCFLSFLITQLSFPINGRVWGYR